MFTRVYQACNGTVELYVQTVHHKEAMDWARLSTSEIAKELNDKSMEEVFLKPQDAYDKLAVQPDWKPHTLGKRIEHLVTPEGTKKTNYTRKQMVTLSYDKENTQDQTTKGKESYQKKRQKLRRKKHLFTTKKLPELERLNRNKRVKKESSEENHRKP